MIIKHKFSRLTCLYFYNEIEENNYELLGDWNIDILDYEKSASLYCINKNLNHYFYMLCYAENNMRSTYITFNLMKQAIDFIKMRENCPRIKFDN